MTAYLTAYEITGLLLDADWVILPACNTAAGGAQGAVAPSSMPGPGRFRTRIGRSIGCHR